LSKLATAAFGKLMHSTWKKIFTEPYVMGRVPTEASP